jgi:hypothetical protein
MLKGNTASPPGRVHGDAYEQSAGVSFGCVLHLAQNEMSSLTF